MTQRFDSLMDEKWQPNRPFMDLCRIYSFIYSQLHLFVRLSLWFHMKTDIFSVSNFVHKIKRDIFPSLELLYYYQTSYILLYRLELNCPSSSHTPDYFLCWPCLCPFWLCGYIWLFFYFMFVVFILYTIRS